MAARGNSANAAAVVCVTFAWVSAPVSFVHSASVEGVFALGDLNVLGQGVRSAGFAAVFAILRLLTAITLTNRYALL